MGQYMHHDGTPLTEAENAAEDERRAKQQAELDARNRVTFARRAAAKALGSEDHWGTGLTEEQWTPYLPQADRRLQFRVTERHPGYNHETVQGTCPEDATAAEVREYFYHSHFGGRDEWAAGGRFGCTIHTD